MCIQYKFTIVVLERVRKVEKTSCEPTMKMNTFKFCQKSRSHTVHLAFVKQRKVNKIAFVVFHSTHQLIVMNRMIMWTVLLVLSAVHSFDNGGTKAGRYKLIVRDNGLAAGSILCEANRTSEWFRGNEFLFNTNQWPGANLESNYVLFVFLSKIRSQCRNKME